MKDQLSSNPVTNSREPRRMGATHHFTPVIAPLFKSVVRRFRAAAPTPTAYALHARSATLGRVP